MEDQEDGGQRQIPPLIQVPIMPIPLAGAPPEHTKATPPSIQDVLRILREIANENADEESDSEFLLPKRKLLNIIDIMQKDLIEELERKRTNPTAKT
ncbi:hypothetical protein CCACVL1_24454 [Corchorus capsularis]|uniref:Uncharacterized protein n=1 Tax=Corchorus capsularis TaxID=210143 RepID=A0A1R3GPN6_COCAP|nr:hypothetical protein CCACVL1_24454 [Corchorus capsularis]